MEPYKPGINNIVLSFLDLVYNKQDDSFSRDFYKSYYESVKEAFRRLPAVRWRFLDKDRS